MPFPWVLGYSTLSYAPRPIYSFFSSPPSLLANPYADVSTDLRPHTTSQGDIIEDLVLGAYIYGSLVPTPLRDHYTLSKFQLNVWEPTKAQMHGARENV